MRWLLIDKILECEPGESAMGTKCFSRSETFFMDHFPGMPIVPGVLQIEMMAQMAGKCIGLKVPEKLPVLGSVKNARFYRSIEPGDVCVIKAKIQKIAAQFALADAVVEVDGKKCSSATILFAYVPRSRLSSESFDGVVQEWKARQLRKAESAGEQA